MNDPVSTPAPAWQRIADAFDRCRTFAITTHVNPDGDGLGAELGLWSYLKQQGKDVRIINPDNLPPRYNFLLDEAPFEAYDPDTHEDFISRAEVVVVLDISNWDRLAALGKRFQNAAAKKICIDHHPFENNGMADLYAVDISASSTGQLVYEMIRKRGHDVDRRMAMGFYISILTDTGSFRFSNSDARAHQAAGELIDKGLDPNELYERVYGHSSLPRMRLLGAVLQEMRVEEDGKLLFLLLTRDLMDRTGTLPSDTEGFVDIARTVTGTEGVALFMERDDGQIKLSLRSRGRINVNRVAASMGGGGHVLASGATVPGPLEAACQQVLTGMRQELAALDTDASTTSSTS